MSWFRPKYSSPAVEDALLKVRLLEIHERVVRRDSDVSKRRNAVEEILQTTRVVRACLEEAPPASMLIYFMAKTSAEDRIEMEAKTEVGKLAKGMRRACLALYPATNDADAGVRSLAFTGMADVHDRGKLNPDVPASYLLKTDVLARDLDRGLQDSDASVRAAVAVSLGRLVKSCLDLQEPVGSAVGALVAHLDDPDPLVREAVLSAIRHGLSGISPETLAVRLTEGDEWQRAVDAIKQPAAAAPDQTLPATGAECPVEERSSLADPIETLLAIYAANPDGFAPGYGNPDERGRVRQVGEALNREGGMDLMLDVHAEFARRCRIQGAARNLEHTWDRIGDWLG
jgi:hypothetical protein